MGLPLQSLPPLEDMDENGSGFFNATSGSNDFSSPAASGSTPSSSLADVASRTSAGLGAAGKYAASSAIGALSTIFGVDAQSVTIIAGLILIGGGIFLFKPVQQIVVSGGRKAARAAAGV
jgi:hypothetical protein